MVWITTNGNNTASRMARPQVIDSNQLSQLRAKSCCRRVNRCVFLKRYRQATTRTNSFNIRSPSDALSVDEANTNGLNNQLGYCKLGKPTVTISRRMPYR